MVGTIAPVVYGQKDKRHRWRAAISLHILGSATAGVLVGLILSYIGLFITVGHIGWTALALVVLGTFSCLYALHELRILRLPYPQRQRQVDGGWRYRFHPYVVAWLYGLGLGTGFTTFVAVATLYVLAAGALLSGDPLYAAALFGSFGLLRATFLALMVRRIQTRAQSEQVFRRMLLVSQLVHVANGLALAFTGAFMIAASLQRMS